MMTICPQTKYHPLLASYPISNPSNASPSDPVFSVLPDYLSYLSLNPYPLPYLDPAHSDGAVPVEIMPDIALFQILTSRKFENLETLVISYSWNSRESETALLNALV